MRCILRTKPKNWMLRKYFKSLLKPADIGRAEKSHLSCLSCAFLRRKTSLNFRLRKDAKEREEKNVEQKTISFCLLLTFNTMHLGMDGSILINVMEKFPLSERRSMSKERSRHDIGRRRTSLTFSFLFAFSLRKYLCKIISSH